MISDKFLIKIPKAMFLGFSADILKTSIYLSASELFRIIQEKKESLVWSFQNGD